MHPRLVTLAALVAFPVAIAGAQSASPKNVVSIQPLNMVFQVYTGEFERAASKSVTWGLGGTLWNLPDDFDDLTYTSGEFKLRFYPAGVALHGFSIGGSAGYSRISAPSPSGADNSDGAPTLGVLLEYQWLTGAKQNFAFALGAGAKAIFLTENNNSVDRVSRYPTIRISFGFAF